MVSDMNARQELFDERLASLEERLVAIHEQLEALPDAVARCCHSSLSQPPVPSQSYPPGSLLPSQQQQLQQQQQVPPDCGGPYPAAVPGQPSYPPHPPPKHTHLHPDDAASLTSRPSWSSVNLSGGRLGVMAPPMVARSGSTEN
ncbi:hypothetical protein ISCGN_006696 [Ixodes scapularis]